MPTLTPESAADTRALRRISEMLCLPGLCGQTGCRRTRTCHGEPRDCLSRYAPLVPEDAREGAKAMIAARRDGSSFENLLDDAREDVMALAAWADAVAQSCRPHRRPRG